MLLASAVALYSMWHLCNVEKDAKAGMSWRERLTILLLRNKNPTFDYRKRRFYPSLFTIHGLSICDVIMPTQG